MTKNKSRPVFLLALGLLLASMAQGQQSTNASGGDATGSGGIASYSVGQVVYTINTDATGTVSQGVQHPYEIIPAGINETKLNISLFIFPNPTSTNLTLQIQDYCNEKLSYQLFDLQGKLLDSEQVLAQQTQINTANLPAATYFIHVVNEENKQVQAFRITKK